VRKTIPAVAVALAALAAGAALAATLMGPTVGVTLKEFKVLAPASSKAGKVTFVVANKGTLKHEFVVVKTKLAPGKLPLKGAVVDLKKLAVAGRLTPLKPGTTKRLTLTLKTGKYVLFCNLPAHYKAGQFKGFRIS
jgi:uncharacterized cupredoxin-like copper-binding protein